MWAGGEPHSQHPDDAVGHALEDAHPSAEHIRVDLPKINQTNKQTNKRTNKQTNNETVRHGGGSASADAIARRNIAQPLRHEALPDGVRWHQHGTGGWSAKARQAMHRERPRSSCGTTHACRRTDVCALARTLTRARTHAHIHIDGLAYAPRNAARNVRACAQAAQPARLQSRRH